MSHQPNNIFAGTQVVARVAVHGANHSLVHPRGAVGVVTRTPAVPGEKFLVRFPDGFEKFLGVSESIQWKANFPLKSCIIRCWPGTICLICVIE